MDWINLTSLGQIDQIIDQSNDRPVLIFKHSIRCGTSAMVLDRLQRNWNHSELPEMNLYFLDLIVFREVSKKIAEVLNVWHQSPQIIVVINGKCVYEASHFSISFEGLSKNLGRIEVA
ncbi:MAG: bacillithiol system redox-active protein YtxJ [Bacteroidetes bacterium]|nr:bacillithiol system redox-active protein YtxJ [Bacteroidota bacterium]MDA1119230.1 bacillithiol system redox-active protein YtxJ [Bacteroidota bacterium]